MKIERNTAGYERIRHRAALLVRRPKERMWTLYIAGRLVAQDASAGWLMRKADRLAA